MRSRRCRSSLGQVGNALRLVARTRRAVEAERLAATLKMHHRADEYIRENRGLQKFAGLAPLFVRLSPRIEGASHEICASDFDPKRSLPSTRFQPTKRLKRGKIRVTPISQSAFVCVRLNGVQSSNFLGRRRH